MIKRGENEVVYPVWRGTRSDLIYELLQVPFWLNFDEVKST